MEILFLELLQISALCGVGILLIFVVSPLFRRTHTVFWRYCLWTLLAIRLILPFDFSLPKQAVVISFPDHLLTEEKTPAVFSGNSSNPAENLLAAQKAEDKTGSNETENSKIVNEKSDVDKIHNGTERNLQTGDLSNQSLQENADIWERVLWWASVVWAMGAIAIFIWHVACYVNFSYKVNRTKTFYGQKESLSVYTSSVVFSPILMGIRKPQIVLPNREYAKEELAFILEHEFTHYKRKDIWVRFLLAFAKTLHWFNPCVICMERQAIQDMELLCDSRVVKYFSREEKKQYSAALLNCASSEKSRITVLCTSEFSRNVKTLKERFANIFSGEGKKQGVLAIVLGAFLLLSVSLFVAFGTSEKAAEKVIEKDTENVSLESENSALKKKNPDIQLISLLEEEAANAIYGAVFPKLVYASDKRAVLYDYWGLLIYDFEHDKIEQILDLKAADLNHIQGEKVTHVEVSADGGQILLYNEPDTKERFVYDIDDKKLSYSDLDSFAENHYDGLYEREERTYAYTDTGKRVYLSADSLWKREGESYHSEDMRGLSLVVSNNSWGDSEIYPLFSESFKGKQEEVVPRLKISDLCRILGKEYLYKDRDGWSYYLEEDEEKESALWEIGSGLEPLLLTRYKDEVRQVLEDLIFQETWRETPVLFAGGRIIYRAAKTADIVGVKDATLVSIAMDGSDRKIADTIMYRVFDGLCEDDGWIYYSGWTNDNLFPKPLCRISPDFSSGAQFVEEIPGYLCGVKDGEVYYLAGKEKQQEGIWKRNLETGEEKVYDKWGLAAEDMTSFQVRERVFLKGELGDYQRQGCQILYSYDWSGGICDTSCPFD